jgi:hypothetical protein
MFRRVLVVDRDALCSFSDKATAALMTMYRMRFHAQIDGQSGRVVRA